MTFVGGSVYKSRLADILKTKLTTSSVQQLMLSTDRPHTAETWFSLKGLAVNHPEVVPYLLSYVSPDVQKKKMSSYSAVAMLHDVRDTFTDKEGVVSSAVALNVDEELSRVHVLEKDVRRACNALLRVQQRTSRPLTVKHFAPLLRVSNEIPLEDVKPHILDLVKSTERFGKPGFTVRIVIPFMALEFCMAYVLYWQHTLPATVVLLALLWKCKYG